VPHDGGNIFGREAREILQSLLIAIISLLLPVSAWQNEISLANMLILKKVTLQYVLNEDRICMTAEPDGMKPIIFWLTLHVCRQLVPVLCGHLERSTPERPVIGREMQLSCTQRDAEWRYESQAPVETSEAALMYLPSRIDYAFSGDITGLSLPLGEEEKADLRLTMQELRQLMAIMYRLFLHAGWPTDVWPAWFTDDEPGQN
jgi:hypothetical protein